MNARKIVLLAVALVIAGGTMMLSRSMMSEPKAVQGDGVAATSATLETSEVLVAVRDMPVGTMLKEMDMKWQTWPTNGLNDTFAVKGQKNISEYVGTMLRQGIRTGEPILSSRIIRAAEQGFMAAALAPGMRAITIPITPASGVAGFAFPGDRVDVIVTHKVMQKPASSDLGGAGEHRVSETVLTDVRVLALDQKTNDQVKDAKPAQLATLEVTPKQAERLILATEMGTTSLVLRGIAVESNEKAAQPKNDESVPTSGVEISDQATANESSEAQNTNPTTWDSDVSSVLPEPANRSGRYKRIQIMRGKETSETIFDSR